MMIRPTKSMNVSIAKDIIALEGVIWLRGKLEYLKNDRKSMKQWLDMLSNFMRINPILGSLSVLGTGYCFMRVLDFLQAGWRYLRQGSIEGLRKRFKGDWALVCDISRPLGQHYVRLLAKAGYSILCLTTPSSEISDLQHGVEVLGLKFESVNVGDHGQKPTQKDVDSFRALIANKEIGIAVLNLHYEWACKFDIELPVALMASINAGVNRFTDYLLAILAHLAQQPGRSAVVTVGSILSEGKWPYHQLTCGSAAYMDEFTASLSRHYSPQITFLRLSRGYVPSLLESSFYRVESNMEAANSLQMLGAFQKGMSHYRVWLQDFYHSCRLGKANRQAYSRAALLHK